MIKDMSKFLVFVVVAFFAIAVEVSADPDSYVNVLDFVRKEGNKKDHTQAIRKAFKATSTSDPAIGGRHLGVYFPPGNYNISDTIEIGGQRIKGLNATINQLNPDKDIFRSKSCHMLYISGLNFKGGKDQIHLEIPGSGGGIFWRIVDCNFYKAKGWAIYLKTWMTVALIERGEIKDCERMIYAELDSVTIKEMHGRSDLNNYGTAFDLRCPMAKMEDCLWTPMTTNADPRWIDNRCSLLTIKDTRFGGESGGFTPVVNYTKYSDLLGSGILIENSFLCNQSNVKRRAAVYCEEIPNRIVMRNCSIGGIPAIGVSDKINLADYFIRRKSPLELSYNIESCGGNLGGIPELLRKPIVKVEKEECLSDSKVDKFMKQAVSSLASFKEPANPKPLTAKDKTTGKEHTEQTDPTKYLEAPLGKYLITGNADAETIPNNTYFAIKGAGDDLIVMKKKWKTGNCWALLKGFTVDVDKYPYLSRKIKLNSSYHLKPHYPYPPMRVIDTKTGKGCLLNGGYNPYGVLDLRKAFGPGVHTFDIRIYWGGWWSSTRQKVEAGFKTPKDSKTHFEGDFLVGLPPLGTYMVLDYIRAEKDN